MAAGVVAPAPGRLLVVSTPIGNMGDFSFRAVEVLRDAALIVAEDTRHSRPLLARHGITTPVRSHHAHNEARTTGDLVARLLAGEDVALISDAGTPLVSDPGARLVRAAIDAGITVVPVPGASALLAALVGAGLDTERFTFFGFLPRRGGDRTRAVATIVALEHTAVLYEAPSRVAATLADLAAAGAGGREAVVAREVTKVHEEFRRGTVDALAAYYRDAAPRGEVVLCVAGGAPPVVDDGLARERARQLREEGVRPSEIAKALTAELGVSRNAAYRLARES